MNKIVNINLGGMPFQIDENGYEMLMNYLASIEKHFANTSGKEEIVDDIEKRLAEILNEKIKTGKQIISLQDVEEIIAIMGKPEQMGEAEGSATQEQPFTDTTHATKNQWYRRRLYRNTDNKILGGVCSGLAAALGADPIWIRLAFVAGILLFGTGFLLYIILWIIIPEAKTTTEKLEMQGEPINIHNIGKQMTEDAKAFGERMKKWGKEVKDSFDSSSNYYHKKKDQYKKSSTSGYAFHNLIKYMGRFITIVIQIIVLCILLVFAAILLRALGWINIGNFPYEFEYIFNSHEQSRIVLWTLLIVVIISFLSVIVKLIKRIFNIHTKKTVALTYIARVVSFIGIVIGVVNAIMIANDFSKVGEVHSTIPINASVKNKLYVQLLDNKLLKNEDDNFLIDPTITLQVQPSADTLFHLEQYAYAYSSKQSMAQHLAAKIELPIIQQDSVLNISPYYNWLSSGKWRNQSVELILKIPQHKIAYVDEDIINTVNIDFNNAATMQDVNAFAGKYAQWSNKDGQLVCLNMDSNITKVHEQLINVDLHQVNRIKARGDFMLNVQHGSQPSLYINRYNQQYFNIYVHGRTLYIKEKKWLSRSLRKNVHTKVILMLPNLMDMDIDDDIELHVDSAIERS